YIPEGVNQNIFRLVINRTTASIDVLGLTSEQMTARIQTLLKAVVNPDQFDEAAFKSQAAEAMKLLLPPDLFSSSRSGTRRLFIAPTGILHLFPFSLLVDEQGHYLDENEQLEIAYVPSATIVRRPAPRFTEAARSAGFVNPALDDDHHQALSEIGDLKSRFSDSFRSWGKGVLTWEEPLNAQQFLAQARNLDNVFLYSHGRFVPNDPMASYLRFADEQGQPAYVSAAQ